MISTYLIKTTPTGIQVNLLNPAVVIITIEIIIGLIFYEIIKKKELIN